jgi:hypothetical protein
LRANATQVGGNHYKSKELEHWDLAAIYSWDYFQGQITKYVMRWRDKNGLVDLQKAQHVIAKYIEIETLRAEGKLTHRLLMDAIEKIEAANSMEEHGASRRLEEPKHNHETWVVCVTGCPAHVEPLDGSHLPRSGAL